MYFSSIHPFDIVMQLFKLLLLLQIRASYIKLGVLELKQWNVKAQNRAHHINSIWKVLIFYAKATSTSVSFSMLSNQSSTCEIWSVKMNSRLTWADLQ